MFTVVVPTYNERENIRPLVERVMEAFRAIPEPAELLFVDDDSPDGTAEEIRTVSREVSDGGNDNFERTIRVIVREGERSLSGAVNRGFRGECTAICSIPRWQESDCPTTLTCGVRRSIRRPER